MKDEWSDAEWSALRMDGHAGEWGPALMPIDTPDAWWSRLEAASWALPARAVIDRCSAAWVWGAIAVAPRTTQWCFALHARSTKLLPSQTGIKNRRLSPDDIAVYERWSATSPERTLRDLVSENTRVAQNASESEHDMVLEAVQNLLSALAQSPETLQRRWELEGHSRAARMLERWSASFR